MLYLLDSDEDRRMGLGFGGTASSLPSLRLTTRQWGSGDPMAVLAKGDIPLPQSTLIVDYFNIVH
jgi:hypothetical protein